MGVIRFIEKKNNISNIQSVSFYGLSFMPKRIKINGETNKKNLVKYM